MAPSSALYAAGYLTGVAAFIIMARRRRLLTDGILALMAIGLIGGLAGAGIAQAVVAGAPGKTVLGGLAGGYLAVWIAKRALNIRRPLGDLFAVALAAGEAVGRWGCFFAGCCYGTPCALPWAILQHGALRHPTQIYSSIASLLTLGLLVCVERTRPPENFLFWLQGLAFCVTRFAIEFYRVGRHDLVGLSPAQWGCLFGGLFFACQLLRRRRSNMRAMPAITTGVELSS